MMALVSRVSKQLFIKYLLILGFILFTPFAYADIEAGRDYVILPDNIYAQNIAHNNTHVPKVHVIEFFSYACPACFKLESYLEKWLGHKPSHVVFERIPVIFDPDWSVYAKTYLAAKNLNLDKKITAEVFQAIHTNNLDLSKLDAMTAFLKSKNIDKDNFTNAYNSPNAAIVFDQNKKITKELMIFQIPAIIIDGKYKVDPSLTGANYHRFFEVVNYLIHKEKEKQK